MSTTTEAKRTLLDELAAALVLWAETPAERVERTESDIREVALRAEALGLTELAAALNTNASDQVVPLPFRVLRIREALYAADTVVSPRTDADPQPDTRPAFARRRDNAPAHPEPPASGGAPAEPITNDPRSALEAIDAVEAGLEELAGSIHEAFTSSGPFEAQPTGHQTADAGADEQAPASTEALDDTPASPRSQPDEAAPAFRPPFPLGPGTPIFGEAQPEAHPLPAQAPWARRADVPIAQEVPPPGRSSNAAETPEPEPEPDSDTADIEDTADTGYTRYTGDSDPGALFEPAPFNGGDVADERAELVRLPDRPAALPAPRERPLLADPATLEPIGIAARDTPPEPGSRSPVPISYANWFTTPFEVSPAPPPPSPIDDNPARITPAKPEPEPEPSVTQTPAFANWFTQPFSAADVHAPPEAPAIPASSIDILLSYDGLAEDEGEVVACDDFQPTGPEPFPFADEFAIEPVAPLSFDEATEPTVEPRARAESPGPSLDHVFQDHIDEPDAFAVTDEHAGPLTEHRLGEAPEDHFAASLFPGVTPEDAIESPPVDAESPVTIDDFADDLPLFDASPEPDCPPETAPAFEAAIQPEPEPVPEREPELAPEEDLETGPTQPTEPMLAAASVCDAEPDAPAPDNHEACEEPEPVSEPEDQDEPEQREAPEPVRAAEAEPVREPVPTHPAQEPATSEPGTEPAEGFTISAEHIDTLMDSVRRLVLGKNRLASLASSIHAAAANATAPDLAEAESLRVIADEIARVTTDLQSGVMRTRMVTIDELAAPFTARLRAWADVNSTPVDLELSGGATLVDIALADALRDLLSAWADALAGSILTRGTGPRCVRLSAESAGTQIRLVITDDAETFDIVPLRARAIADGAPAPDDDDDFRDACLDGSLPNTPFDALASPAAACDAELTLRPGSGRGSAGNTLSVTIPTRSTVISAMMVRVGEAIYAIPLGAVVEVVKPRRDQVGKVNDAPVLRLRNEVFPVLDLHAALGELPPQASPAAVVAQSGAQTAVLLVTGLIGQREIVIEDLDASSASGPFSGATIRDDGGVSLILDLGQILRAGGTGLDPAMLQLMPVGDETLRRAG